jgi:hypothetical protein
MHSTVMFRLFAVLVILSVVEAIGVAVPVNITEQGSEYIVQ